MQTTRRDILKMISLAVASQGIPFGLYSAVQDELSNTPPSNPLQSAFNPATGSWEIEWPGKISQYDLVYLSPPVDPLQGIPFGNGDIGILVWCEESKIIAAVNKCDLWDDAAFTSFKNWSKEQEDLSTTLRHACRIVIDFKYPVFSTLYLKDFHARLNLADASMELSADGPFGAVRFKAVCDHASGNIFYDVETDFKEKSDLSIILERYGSRTFSHWYSLINRDASIGSGGTSSFADQRGVYLAQDLTGSRFAVGGKVIEHNNLSVSYEREHSRSAVIAVSGAVNKKLQLAFAVSDPVGSDPLPGLQSRLERIGPTELDAFRKNHQQTWQALWNRSFLDYGDDYLNNLWRLTIYYAITSQSGKYPGRFNNGLWTWSRDVQNWNFYFHWNQQQLYWPLNAAGYHELMDGYLDFRFKSLEHAKKDAVALLKAKGAFISDVTERRGYNSGNEVDNHTPVAEIAMEFWRQYQYTKDNTFLKEKALPFIIEAARFFETLFEKGDDGLYHSTEGTGYEGWIKLKDSLTEIVYGRVLFSTALQAIRESGADIPESAKWKDILDHLAPLPVVKAGDDLIAQEGNSFTIQRGYFKGKKTTTDNIVSAGWGIKEKKWLTTYFAAENGKFWNLNLLDGIFPTVPSSPVFPSGLIGLSQKGKADNLFETMRSTTVLYGAGITGWDTAPIVMARLGLKDELQKTLTHFPERWQIYCNGWGHWGMEGEVKKDAEWFFRTNAVKDVKDDANQPRFQLPMWPFRHMSMEAMSVFAAALNESLLQSHDGIIRIAPAIPDTKSCRFTLHATGGFVVSAEIETGKILWVSVKSAKGGICRLALPWENAGIFSGSRKIKPVIEKDAVSIKTVIGETIMLLPPGIKMNAWKVSLEKRGRNEKEKSYNEGNARLGLPRMF